MLPLITAALPILGKVLDSVLPDTEARDKAKAELSMAMVSHSADLEKAAASVIKAEAQGDSWLQRNWRPLLMTSFMAIIVNNYILAPYLNAFEVTVVTLEVPPGMWALLNVGVGGYILGRSGEKIMKERNKG